MTEENPQRRPDTQPPPRGRRKKPDLERDTLHGVSPVGKRSKRPKLHVTVFPRGGSPPYTEQVEVQEGGTFSLPKSGLSYYIAPSSVWREDGKYRCIVNEGSPATLSPQNIEGDGSMTPEAFNGFVENNLWMQYGAEVKTRSGWQTAAGVGLGLAVMAIIGVMIWMIVSITGDLEGIRTAIENMPANQGGGQPTPAEEAGHQPIAPGGR